MPPAPAGGEDLLAQVDDRTSCVVVQNPDVFGHVRDYSDLAAACRAKGVLVRGTFQVSADCDAAGYAFDASSRSNNSTFVVPGGVGLTTGPAAVAVSASVVGRPSVSIAGPSRR